MDSFYYEQIFSALFNILKGESFSRSIVGLTICICLYLAVKSVKFYYNHRSKNKVKKSEKSFQTSLSNKKKYDLKEPENPVNGDKCVYFDMLYAYNGDKWSLISKGYTPEVGCIVENSDGKSVWNGRDWESSEFMVSKPKDRFDTPRSVTAAKGDEQVYMGNKYVFEEDAWVIKAVNYIPTVGDVIKCDDKLMTWNDSWENIATKDESSDKTESSDFISDELSSTKTDEESQFGDHIKLTSQIFNKIESLKDARSEAYMNTVNLCFDMIDAGISIHKEEESGTYLSLYRKRLNDLSSLLSSAIDSGNLSNDKFARACALYSKVFEKQNELKKNETVKKNPIKKRNINKNIKKSLKGAGFFGEYANKEDTPYLRSEIINDIHEIVFKNEERISLHSVNVYSEPDEGLKAELSYTIYEDNAEGQCIVNIRQEMITKPNRLEKVSSNLDDIVILIDDINKELIERIESSKTLLKASIDSVEFKLQKQNDSSDMQAKITEVQIQDLYSKIKKIEIDEVETKRILKTEMSYLPSLSISSTSGSSDTGVFSFNSDVTNKFDSINLKSDNNNSWFKKI